MGFSVLMSVYNKENPVFLNQALESIWDKQTLRPSEIILVKDGYLNDSIEQIVQYWKSKLKEVLILIQLDQNVGLGPALNIGLNICSYELIARMDSDDIATPDRFEIQANFLAKNPQITVVGSFVEEFRTNPGDLNYKRELPLIPTDLLNFSKYRCPLNHMTIMFRKAAVVNVGSYECVPSFEDYYLYTKLLYNGFELANLDKVLLFMRTGNDMIARRHGIKYAKYEFSFFYRIYKDGYLTFNQMIVNLCLRIPFRFLPKIFLKLLYRYKLRN